MKVIIACEYSGIVSKAFRDKGHEAWSCDILPTEGRKLYHFQCKVETVLYGDWDMLIVFDPCTYQCNSGVRWLKSDLSRWNKLIESCKFTTMLLNAPIEKICRENPIPHKYAINLIGRKYDQIIQPWQFGHGETKATCLWLKNLPLLKPENIVEGREQRIWKMPPRADRSKERSRTYQGIANAMANHWS